MPIDIRATVTCTLGPLIEASVSDDYVQGTGVIKTKGSCTIASVIRPKSGTRVVINYTKKDKYGVTITRKIPRTLFVISSFADPIRKITTVSVGCPFTLKQNMQSIETLTIKSEDDQDRDEITGAPSKIVTTPIFAKGVAEVIMARLGYVREAQDVGQWLGNKFSISSFEFTAPYVSILSDLLYSESRIAYFNADNKPQARPLRYAASFGFKSPIIRSSSIIDLGPINIGTLPGNQVFVNYSYRKLKAPPDVTVVCELTPEEEEERLKGVNVEDSPWSTEANLAVNTGSFAIPYDSNGEQATKTYKQYQRVYEETVYKLLEVNNGATTAVFYSEKNEGTNPEKQYIRVPVQRITYKDETAAGIAGSLATAYLSAGYTFGDFTIRETTTETFNYDGKGNEVKRTLIRKGDALYGLGWLSIPYSYIGEDGVVGVVDVPSGEVILEKITVDTYINGKYRKTVTKRYAPWATTIPGQQAIAESRDTFTTAAQANAFIAATLSADNLYLVDTTVSTEKTGGVTQGEAAPQPEELAMQEYADDETDPDNGFTVEVTAESANTATPYGSYPIQFSMPYADDETFEAYPVPGSDPVRYCFTATESLAKYKAQELGSLQNRLLYGALNGMNIQVLPEVLPSEPFSDIVIELNGVQASYRTNGTTWTASSDGIIASTDAIYWGIYGKSI